MKRYPLGTYPGYRSLNATTLLVITVVMLLQIADVVTTELCLSHGGREGNPLMAYLFHKGGRPFGYSVKLGMILALALWCANKKISMAMLAGQSAIGAINNIVWMIEAHA